MADEKTKSDKDEKPKTKKSTPAKKSSASTKKADTAAKKAPAKGAKKSSSTAKKTSSTAKKSSSTAKKTTSAKSSSKAKPAKKSEETVDAPADEKPKRERRRKPRETPETPEPKTKAKADSKSKSKPKAKADAAEDKAESKPNAKAASKSKSKPKADSKSKSKPKADDKPKSKSKSNDKGKDKKDEKKRPERDLPATPAKLRDAAVKMLTGLFERMELDIQPKPQKLTGNTVNIDFSGPDAGALLGLNQSSPRVLEAVQTLTRQALTDGRTMKLVLDVGGFRQKRTKRLEDVAAKLAEVAEKAGQPVVVAGFNSFERKVVHQALEDTKSVKTDSEGYGSFRKLRLEPR